MNPAQMKELQKEMEELQEIKDTSKMIEKFQEYIEKTKKMAKDLHKRIEKLQKDQKLIEGIPNLQPMFKELQSCIEEGQKHLKIWRKGIEEKQNLLEELKKSIKFNTKLDPIRFALTPTSQPSAITSGRDPAPCANQFIFASSSATCEVIDKTSEVETATVTPNFKCS